MSTARGLGVSVLVCRCLCAWGWRFFWGVGVGPLGLFVGASEVIESMGKGAILLRIFVVSEGVCQEELLLGVGKLVGVVLCSPRSSFENLGIERFVLVPRIGS